MSIHLTNNLLALGIKPVGSVIGGDVQDFLPHVKDQLDGVVKYGVVADPDMKALLASKPDYIFIDAVYSGDELDKFEKIAPTIAVDMDEGTWRDHLLQMAGYVGREAEAESFIANYEEKGGACRRPDQSQARGRGESDGDPDDRQGTARDEHGQTARAHHVPGPRAQHGGRG
ncbi:ABC transporter substrate-binding protein [Paenibacillus cisolokensis]|uniref:ABC transporter substrate-binding protein n=1 Tax=Paenibacillus cisolokensis TaxID=1658519 RepID=UPI003D2BDCF3